VNLLRKLDLGARPLVSALFVGVVAIGLPIATASHAAASTVDWVDGGDDQMCLQDDMGAALTRLAEDKYCQPIPSCHEYDGNNPKYRGRIVHSSASTGIWQGASNEVLYEDDLPSDYYLTTSEPTKAPTPTATPTKPPTSAPTPSKAPTSAPTKAPTTTPTKTPTRTPTRAPSSAPKPGASTPAPGTKTPTGTNPTRGTTTGTSSTPTPTEELGIDPAEQIAEGAPTAPDAPTLTVDGSAIVVSWKPSADVDLDSVTGYVIQLSGGNRAEVDAATTTYEFRDLPDGSYRAAVRAVNASGESAASTPSEAVRIGTPVASVVGTLVWTGDVSPGATVTVTGSGYAPVADLDLELHSDPVLLATVRTDEQGSFSTDVVVPADIPAGAHNFVVAYQGTVISQSPVSVVAAPVAAPVVDATAETAAEPETVPPLTGLVILIALAVAGVLLLISHYARGRSHPVGAVAAAPQAAATTTGGNTVAQTTPTATLPPLQLDNPLTTAFAPASGVASPARPYSDVRAASVAGQASTPTQFAPPVQTGGPQSAATRPTR
jgi:hypothetical protein